MKFTPEQVIEMAREAGWCVPEDAATDWIARQARLCTLAADRAFIAGREKGLMDAAAFIGPDLQTGEGESLADAIRAMKEHQ